MLFLEEEDDLSVSGSDSETDDIANKPSSDLFAAATRHCKAFFTNQQGQVFCVYRCILHHKKVGNYLKLILTKCGCWIIMCILEYKNKPHFCNQLP